MFEKYKCAELTACPNNMLIPVSTINLDDEGVAEFNEIFKYLKNSTYNKIIRTPSGGISLKTRYPAYDIRNTTYCIEITILDTYGMRRIQIRAALGTNNVTIRGRNAFNKFKKILKKNKINLDDYIIENGKEIKETIEKPYIKLNSNSFADMTFENVYHIDFHNSYPAGLVNTHPEFKNVIEFLYDKRKENPEYKAILNLSIGFMQSEKCCKAKWAHLSRDAISDNNRRIENIAKRLESSGRVILSYNTDGIWYTGDIYHGDGEGDKLGQWSNDHMNCTFRAKSAGAYEYIENGEYHAVVRGSTNLDKIKPRDQWVWGDIYNEDAVPKKWMLTEDGLTEVIDEEG